MEKKSIFKLLLTAVCLLGSTSVSAYDFEVGGIYYDVVSLNEQTCKVVSGNTKYEGDIVIPATVDYGNRTLTVVEIASDAFKYAGGLTGLTIPNTISSINNVSFRWYNNGFYSGIEELERVTIEDGETPLNIGSAFKDTKTSYMYVGRNLLCHSGVNTKEVIIGNSITEISDNMFSGCSDLTSITIPDNVTSIGMDAFENCSGLTSITIPDNVTSIGGGAFAYCSGLTSITIPDNVTSIGMDAFSGCI